MNRLTFQQLAETRLLDAKALLQAGRFDAAYYIAGYVIECALKACIAKKTREHDFPDQDYWQLIIASSLVRQSGPLAAYQKVSTILAKRRVATVSTSDISIFSPTDPEYLRLREYAFGPGQFGVGPENGVPRKTSFADAWAYV